MNLKNVAIAIAASACFSLISHSASATVLTLNYVETGAGAKDFSFTMGSAPQTLSHCCGDANQVPVSNWASSTGNLVSESSVLWYLNSDALSLINNGVFINLSSSPWQAGSAAYPEFFPGVFSGTDQNNGLSGVLTVTAPPAPEPATWAMMLLGAWLIGASLRLGRKAAPLAAA